MPRGLWTHPLSVPCHCAATREADESDELALGHAEVDCIQHYLKVIDKAFDPATAYTLQFNEKKRRSSGRMLRKTQPKRLFAGRRNAPMKSSRSCNENGLCNTGDPVTKA